ncbi:nuclear transport factor 2 family protein [Amycolatopsis magusensis]|uniref:nuclear transport factor 2 family protein n=1 Tax=Amycolatopsis magusensis TaxID=882444 RepID=UPI0024A7BE36|nr:nuclear transport factor 2 family protein [Amycolatopsis magusensis]MDI5975558.1 nuclear transport factor 2 family protein [Amycolatopsis magusensis]
MTLPVPGGARDQELADRLELRELADRYLVSMDRREDEDWCARVFTEDVRAVFPLGEFHGLAGVAEFHAHGRHRFEKTLHTGSTVLVEPDGDVARVRAHLVAVHVPEAARPDTHFMLGGYYDAEAVRRPDGWRFRVLEFHPVWVGGAAELPEVFTGGGLPNA